MKAILEQLTNISAPTTIRRDALTKMDRLDSAKSDSYGKSVSHQSNRTDSFNLVEFNLGELYGCVCHRPTTGIVTPQISSKTNQGLTASQNDF
jgi:hypothetical protein